MGAVLGMNCHERLAVECELTRLDESLFLATQRHVVLQAARESTEKTKGSLHRILAADHPARQAIIAAHNLLVLECAVVSAAMHRITERSRQVRAEIEEDDQQSATA